MVNHDTLRWQYQYGGLKLINLRILVCPECYDEPQVQLRTIILPPDPEPIAFPLPELYPGTDNPVSPIGYSPNLLSGQTFGSNIGTLVNGGGLNASFDGFIGKPYIFSSINKSISNGFNNTIGKSWNTPTSGPGIPGSISTTIRYDVASFSVYGPRNSPLAGSGLGDFSAADFSAADFDMFTFFGTATGLQLQGSSDGINWTVLYSTTTSTGVGQIINSISSNLTRGNFSNHRIAIQGGSSNAVTEIAVAQVQFNVATTGQNEQ